MTDNEREALCKRIDELCAEVERLHADQAHWELGNCPNCPNVVSLQEALEQNVKLRELVWDMWLHSYCSIAKTREEDERHIESVIDRMRGLGIEVIP